MPSFQSLLSGLRVVQVGRGLAAAVCGRLFADVGAAVACIDPDLSSPLAQYLNHGKAVIVERAAIRAALSGACLIVCEGRPEELRRQQRDPAALRRVNETAALVYIAPFGQTGPRAEDPGSDLTLLCSSGIARLLTGQVDDLSEPPIRPAGEQSAFIGGLAAACAGMHAIQVSGPGAVIDLSIEEALATLAIGELARAGVSGVGFSRRRVGDGNGATVTILPARDGFVAISPREDRQWQAWLGVMGLPGWGRDARFRGKPDRIANWDALHALMSVWSRQHDKQWIADAAQAAHVPSFPLRDPAEQFDSVQLRQRGFFRQLAIGGYPVRVPGSPFGLRIMQSATGGDEAPFGMLPLSGIRVLDFSWVIAGPTATRHLAAMGAEVIKIEAPGRGDPGRGSDLHSVLGQGKRGIVLDLKRPEAVEVARALAARSDVLVENFTTGVMDRLGLGADDLRATNPRLIYVSASGLGRSGPESQAVAYGTLLQCYAGFAGLNRHADRPPRVGMAWLDPMCGLMLAFIVAAALWARRRSGAVARVDFSMIEALLWTMAEPLLDVQLTGSSGPLAKRSDGYVLHGIYRCVGDDSWIGIACAGDAEWQALCGIVPGLSPGTGQAAIDEVLRGWLASREAGSAAAELVSAG
ncbi:MAG TPA: CoA transferase, partial [Acetobacteraceae bacterium]|nr:CoA transferase [Acetobacteraceae bacterium]